MEYKTSAIALKYFKYSESSIISKIFTKSNGVKSFLITGAYKRKRKKTALLQPLSLIEITGFSKNKSSFDKLIEAKLSSPITHNIKINLLKLFICEVLSKVILENKKDHKLFDFIWETVLSLNNNLTVSKNFALVFLINLSGHLGFLPNRGELGELELLHLFQNKDDESFFKKNFNLLLINPFQKLKKSERAKMFYFILDFYRENEHELKNLNSHQIISDLK